MWPYPNENELKGTYGVLMFDFTLNDPYCLYVGKDYKITAQDFYEKNFRRFANIDIESTKQIRYKSIDGTLDFNKFLKRLHGGN